jgi:UDP-N-acetylmuramate dehydrogenase
LLTLLKRGKISFLLLGGGSNVLASDALVHKPVVRLSSPYFRKIRSHGFALTVGSGVTLAKVLAYAYRHGLSGIEFLAGIPGTVGGALAMNAGITEKGNNNKVTVQSIGDTVQDVTVMDKNGSIKTLLRTEIQFGYRHSSVSRYIILSCTLRLASADKKRIREKIADYRAYRRKTQNAVWRSAGCIFKNPSGQSAGKLIDLCRLKGTRIGGARICEKHANFIINTGNAKARDVLGLMNLMQKKVKARFGVTLEPEVVVWKN